MQTGKLLLSAGLVLLIANSLLPIDVFGKTLTIDIKPQDIRFEKPAMKRWSKSQRELVSPMEMFMGKNLVKKGETDDFDEEGNENEKKGQESLYSFPVSSETVKRLIFESPQPQFFVVKDSYRIGSDISNNTASEITRLTKMLKENLGMCNRMAKVYNNLGKKITEPVQRVVIEAITDTLRDEKLKADILKDLSKDKISKKLSNSVKKLYEKFNFRYYFAKNNLELLNSDKKKVREAMLRALKKYPDFPAALKDYGRKDVRVFKKNSIVYTVRDEDAIRAAAGKSTWAQMVAAFNVKVEYDCTLNLEPFYERGEKDYNLVELTDTILNPFISDDFKQSKNNLEAYNYAKFLHAGDKWRWIVDENYKSVTESYPRQLEYRKYESHPEYKVIGRAVYDLKGNLVSYNIFDSNTLAFDQEYVKRNKPIGKELARVAYKNNQHGIQSASASAKSYITDQLGLRKKTAAELKAQDRAAKKMANAMLGHASADIKYGKNSNAAKRAKSRAAASFMGALFSGGNYDSDGANWLNQIEKDWMERLGEYSEIYKCYYIIKVPYVVERIDDVTYSVVYYDNQNKPAIKVVSTFKPNGAFQVKQVDNVTVL